MKHRLSNMDAVRVLLGPQNDGRYTVWEDMKHRLCYVISLNQHQKTPEYSSIIGFTLKTEEEFVSKLDNELK